MLLARIDPPAAQRLVADIERIPPVIRALHHREFLDDCAPFIAEAAQVVAEFDIARAEELVWPMGAPARDMALAKVAMVAARTDSTRAGQIALTVTGRPLQNPGPGGWKREAPPPPSTLADPDQAIYWKVRALTEIAIVVPRAALPVQRGYRMTPSGFPRPPPITARCGTSRRPAQRRQQPRLTRSRLGNC